MAHALPVAIAFVFKMGRKGMVALALLVANLVNRMDFAAKQDGMNPAA